MFGENEGSFFEWEESGFRVTSTLWVDPHFSLLVNNLSECAIDGLVSFFLAESIDVDGLAEIGTQIESREVSQT